MIAPAMISTDHTVDSRPIENPERIVVARPVTVDSAISWTGVLRVGEVLREDLDHAGQDRPDQHGGGRLQSSR